MHILSNPCALLASPVFPVLYMNLGPLHTIIALTVIMVHVTMFAVLIVYHQGGPLAEPGLIELRSSISS